MRPTSWLLPKHRPSTSARRKPSRWQHRGGCFGLAFLLLAFAVSSPVHSGDDPSTFYRSGTHQFGTTAIRTSSTLPRQGGTSYGPMNLDDWNPATAWCEGRPDDGVGETIEIRFEWPQKISTIKITDGYVKSAKSFQENNRVKSLRLSAEGLPDFEATLADSAREQKIRFPRPVKTSWVKLTIGGVYKGTKYSDTCLSDVWADLEEHNYDQDP